MSTEPTNLVDLSAVPKGIALDEIIVDFEGKALKEKLSVRDCLVRGLMQDPKQSEYKAGEKLHIFTLAQKISDRSQTVMDFNNESVNRLKKSISNVYSIYIFGYICNLIDPNWKDK